MIKAEVIADSLSPQGQRLTTFVVVFPRIILAEFNTHRMFSRNSASSRAIPFERMLKMVKENPFIPLAFQKDHSGMQGAEYLDETKSDYAKMLWLQGRDAAVKAAESLSREVNTTKQLCNRLLESFMWHTVIVTASEWENFFHLRCPQYTLNVTNTENDGEKVFRSRKDVIKVLPALENATEQDWRVYNKGQAEIHMMALAEAMWDAYNESAPQKLDAGEWHVPFGDRLDITRLDELYRTLIEQGYYDRTPGFFPDLNIQRQELGILKVKIATARCARVSYMNFDGSDDYAKDVQLHDRLSQAGHWSPFEHCAWAMSNTEFELHASGLREEVQSEKLHKKSHLGWSGNFRGFVQYRKTFSGENKK